MNLKFWEKKKEIERVKIYFFRSDSKFDYYEPPLNSDDDNKTFYHPVLGKDHGMYIVDTTCAQFFTLDRKPIYFYQEGIPNPIKFNFKKRYEYYLEQRRKNPNQIVKDEEGNNLDLTFGSIELEYYKNNNFVKKLLGKISPEWMKIIYVLIGLTALSWIINLITIFFRK